MKMDSVPVIDLYLDPVNPRHDPISSQPDIIASLVSSEKIKKLAKDIAVNGISPLELFALIKDKSGSYMVIEGNRRACALMLLNDPEKAPPGDRSFFHDLARKNKGVPNHIEGVVFPDKDSARVWLERRHNGEQEGAGLVPWKADQKARFFKKSNNNALAVSVLDYAYERGFINKEERAGKNVTTAARYLGNPVFRNALGILSKRSESDLKVCVSKDAFDKGVQRFVRDLVDEKGDVTSRSTSADWIGYANRIQADGDAPNPNDKVEPYILSSASSPNEQKETGSTRSRPRNEDGRKRVLDAGFKLKTRRKTLTRIFHEMMSIACDDFPFSSAVMSRLFLEDVYLYYCEDVVGKSPHKKMHVVLNDVITHIDSIKNQLSRDEKKSLEALKRVQANDANVLSPKTLGGFAHAAYTPDPKQIKREWDNIREIVQFIVRKIK